MKVLIVIIFIVVSYFSIGQHLLPVQHDTNSYNHELIAYGNADFSSSSVYNEMSKKLLFGGFISDDIKDDSYSEHKGINRFGLDVSGELEYRNLKVNFIKDNLGFIVKGGYYNYMSLLYSKELFGMSFYGNERYLGENIDFSGSRFQTMSFQKIGFGLIDKKSKSNVTLNFYTISNYAEANVREGQLFQSESGDSVSLTLDGTFDYTAENTFVKGYGFGIDLDFRLPVIFGKDKISYVQFLAKNLGFAHINSRITRYAADTIFTFDGLTFDQLYGDASIFNDQFSLLDTLGIDSMSVTKIRMLPGFIQVGKIVDDHNQARFQSFFGVRIYPSLTYSPLIYAGAHFKTTKWLDFGANISYGGYTGFRAGLYSQVKLKNFALGISSEDILGFMTKRAKGQSLIIRMRCKF